MPRFIKKEQADDIMSVFVKKERVYDMISSFSEEEEEEDAYEVSSVTMEDEVDDIMASSSEEDEVDNDRQANEVRNALVTDKRRELAKVRPFFFRLKCDIRANKFEPLLHRQDVKENTKLLKAAVAERTPSLITVQDFLIGEYGETLHEDFDHEPIEEVLGNFHIARYNQITEDKVEHFVADWRNGANCMESEMYETSKKYVIIYSDHCMNQSLECLRRHVKTIQRRIDARYGQGVFASLRTSQLRKLVGLVFDKHPVWIMSRFRAEQSEMVDFAAIWACESDDRIKWRRFYRNMYIDMMTHTWNFRVKNGDYKAVVEGYWIRWPKQKKVENWNMGDAYELPVVTKLLKMGRLYTGDPEEGSGYFVAPN